MAGLIAKDMNILFKRKRVLVIFLVVCVMMAFSAEGSFIVGYMTFLGAVFSISTIAYDEYGNGLQFIMTLPVDRKTYAMSKYAGSLLSGSVSWLIGVIIMVITNVIKGSAVNIGEDITCSLMVLALSLIMIDVIIPLNLKYGSEKGRIALMVLAGAVTAVSVLIFKIPGTAEKADLFLNNLFSSSLVTMIAVPAFVIVASLISAYISVRVMEQKEL